MRYQAVKHGAATFFARLHASLCKQMILIGLLALLSLSAHGAPGIPGAPGILFTEDFENRNSPPAVTGLTSYTGASGMKYSADAYWLDASYCNGVVLFAANDFCTASEKYEVSVKALTYGLGMFHGSVAELESAALSYSTLPVPAAANGIQLETASAIPMTANRFVTMAVDMAAVWCRDSQPLLNFYFVHSDGSEQSVNSSPLSSCGGSGQAFQTPYTFSGSFISVRAATLRGDRPVLTTGTTNVKLRMRNVQTDPIGNDSAVDNFRLLDVTPQLDKQFAPGPLANGAYGVNASARMIFTITNREDLLIKSGWGFVESLPAGLRFAAMPNPSHTCTAATLSIVGTTLTVTNGTLAAGAASCTVSVNVTSTTAGTYTNRPSNITAITGLDLPGETSVTFIGPTVRLRKELPSGRVGANDQFKLKIGPLMGAGVEATTAGSGTEVTGEAVLNMATAGPMIYFSESMADDNTERLANYDISYTCTNILPNVPMPSGNGRSFSITPVGGDNVICTFRNVARPGADLQIVKTADRPSFRTGDTVTYSLAVTNAGPSAANNAVLRDVPAPGLDCAEAGLPPLTCEAAGGAACPSPLTSSGLLGTAGVTVPSFPVGGSLTVRMSCRVTASGTP